MVSYISRDAPFHVFCAEDEEELRRVLSGGVRSMEEALPTVRKVVLLSPRATGESLPDSVRERVVTWKELVSWHKLAGKNALTFYVALCQMI